MLAAFPMTTMTYRHANTFHLLLMRKNTTNTSAAEMVIFFSHIIAFEPELDTFVPRYDNTNKVPYAPRDSDESGYPHT